VKEEVPPVEQPKKKTTDTIPWTAALMQFERLMDPGGLVPHYQPIVRLLDRETVGFECLARSDVNDLESPEQMFSAANQLEQEEELSEVMRRESTQAAAQLQKPGVLFMTTHPKEGFGYRLEQSLRELRRSSPKLSIAIEIREDIVSDTARTKKFREFLKELDMKLVYDNFGADQNRLRQLVEIPPDYLKFDVDFVRGIDQATDRRRDLVRSLIQAVHKLNIVSVAAGIETEAEARVCGELGFKLGQGFFFGHPKSIETAMDGPAKKLAGV
jgi:EAL domain-containing protein (putative c-di-GMP-specific phosphodiesterase class I)